MPDDFKYKAFVSYSSKDRVWGEWLQSRLEAYRTPKDLVGTEGRFGPVPGRLAPIFRDRVDLEAHADLGGRINEALVNSAFLVVLCSPHAAASPWVNEEILTFKRLGREDRILALIVDGTPHGTDDECFPPALKCKAGPDGELTETPTEPAGADVRETADGKENSRLKIIAGLLGLPLDQIRNRELIAQRQRARRNAILAGLASAVALVAVTASYFALNQRHAALVGRAEYLSTLSRQAAGETSQAELQSVTGGLLIALEALPKHIDNPVSQFQTPFTPQAEASLAYSLLRGRNRYIFRGGRRSIADVHYDNDKPRVVVVSETEPLTVWDVKSAKPIFQAGTRTGEVLKVAFTPDRRNVAISRENLTEVWDVSAKNLLVTVKSDAQNLRVLAITADGARIATGADDGLVELWDARDGSLILRTKLTEHNVSGLSFSKDGTLLAAASVGTFAVLAALDGAVRFRGGAGNGMINDVAFSPDRQTIAVATDKGELSLWSVDDATLKSRHQAHDASIGELEFSPDGQLLATGSLDRTAQLWRAKDMSRIAVLRGHSDWVVELAFRPDSRVLATSSWGPKVRLWAAQTGRLLATLEGSAGGTAKVEFRPDGSEVIVLGNPGEQFSSAHVMDARLARSHIRSLSAESGQVLLASRGDMYVVKGPQGTVTLHDSRNAKSQQQFPTGMPKITTAAWSGDGRLLAVGDDDGQVRVFNAQDGKVTQNYEGNGSQVTALRFSEGGQLAAGSQDGTVRLWQPSDDTPPLVMRDTNGSVNAIHFSAEGKRLITFAEPTAATIWDATDASRIADFKPEESLRDIAAAENGKYLIGGTWDSAAEIWNTETGTRERVIRDFNIGVENVAIGPDGRSFAAVTLDGFAKVFDLETGTITASFEIPETAFMFVDFTPDGRSLIVVSDTSEYFVFDIRSGVLIQRQSLGSRKIIRDITYSRDVRMMTLHYSDGGGSIWHLPPRGQALIDCARAVVPAIVDPNTPGTHEQRALSRQEQIRYFGAERPGSSSRGDGNWLETLFSGTDVAPQTTCGLGDPFRH